MNKNIEKFKLHMQEHDYTPPDIIIADGKLHRFQQKENSTVSEGKWYILDLNKPEVGFYGCCDGSHQQRWAVKRNSAAEKVIYEKKLKAMKKQIPNDSLSVDGTEDEKKRPDTMPTTKACQEEDDSVEESAEDAYVRLATLSVANYERMRKEVAYKLGMRVSALDKEVEKEKKKSGLIAKFIGPRLLSDIFDIFNKTEDDRIRTEDLINSLCADKDNGWSVYSQGEAITPTELAKILKPYGIKSDYIRFPNGTSKGYMRNSFSEAFSRLK